MQENDKQSEFQWEITLRESDRYAGKYFQLLKRFCDLPGGRDLIAEQMEADFRDKLPDCDFDCDACPSRWDCDLEAVHEWFTGDEDDFDDEDEEEEEGDDDDDDAAQADGEKWQPQPGDELFFESDPVFNTVRQNALGWCNIYAAILPPESRRQGLMVLFEIGRSLANLGYSVGNGLYEQPGASIAFAKRSLFHLNEALGGLQTLMHDLPRLSNLLSAMRKHMLKAREAILSHLDRCRKRLNSDVS